MLTVLIADDEELEREYLNRILTKQPEKFYVTGMAENGEEAVELALKKRPDIVILDIYMPVKNGLEAAAFLKQRFPDMIIILNTAYAEFEFARKAVEYHLDGYLLKPSPEKTIIETILNCAKEEPQKPFLRKQKQYIQDIEAYIDVHYKEEITLKELAKVAHFSPTYLSKIFHEETGCTIRTFINQKRIANAKKMILNTDLSMQEIAAQSGFGNISHFNRVFRKLTGKSPMELKKEKQEKRWI